MGFTLKRIIVLVCWLAFLGYWILNWKNVKPTKEKIFNLGNIRLLVLGIVILLLISQFVLNSHLNLPYLQLFKLKAFQSFLFSTISSILAITGLIIAIIARRTLAGNWSSSLDVKKGHKLVTAGIYKRIRHPIYTGVIMMLAATLLSFQSIGEFVIFILLTAFFLYRIKKEEELMTRTFPKEYPAYKKKTKALVPYLF